MASADKLRGTFGAHPLNQLFFGPANMEALQHGIRYGVFKCTGITLDKQSERELQVVMRSIYLQHAKHAPDQDLVSQVRELNARVLDYCVPTVAQEAQGYLTFAATNLKTPQPMQHPINVNIKGDKTLELTRFI